MYRNLSVGEIVPEGAEFYNTKQGWMSATCFVGEEVPEGKFRVYCEDDYKSREALSDLLDTMEDQGVEYSKLLKIFENDVETLCGWLNSFIYLGTLNFSYMERYGIEDIEEGPWDATFTVKEGALYSSGFHGPNGHGGVYEVPVQPNDLLHIG